jgi:hypothetical protein
LQYEHRGWHRIFKNLFVLSGSRDLQHLWKSEVHKIRVWSQLSAIETHPTLSHRIVVQLLHFFMAQGSSSQVSGVGATIGILLVAHWN